MRVLGMLARESDPSANEALYLGKRAPITQETQSLHLRKRDLSLLTYWREAGNALSKALPALSAQMLRRFTTDRRLCLPETPTLILRDLKGGLGLVAQGLPYVEKQPLKITIHSSVLPALPVVPVTLPCDQKGQLQLVGQGWAEGVVWKGIDGDEEYVPPQQPEQQPCGGGPRIPVRLLTPPSKPHDQSLSCSMPNSLVFKEGN